MAMAGRRENLLQAVHAVLDLAPVLQIQTRLEPIPAVGWKFHSAAQAKTLHFVKSVPERGCDHGGRRLLIKSYCRSFHGLILC